LAGLRKAFREQAALGFAAATSIVFLLRGDQLLAPLSSPLWLGFVFLWLFASILCSALAVVHHADHLAERLPEPYGTLILTLAITSIEVFAISAVMTHGENNPTLARDTLLSVIMIILNGMVGLYLLIGGWRRPEQSHNIQGANAYLGVIVPLATLALILPTFLKSGSGETTTMTQIVLCLVSVILYFVFLLLQSGRHHHFFAEQHDDFRRSPVERQSVESVALHATLLLLNMVPVVYLVEKLAVPVDYIIETVHAPAALGGVAMAILVATPEAISAVRASVANHLQRAVNISLGSVLSTIAITVPVMLLIGQFTGHPVALGVGGGDLVILVVTLALSIITFASGRTHVMQGAVHLVLFLAYALLIFQQ
jgi:Ca2+:H+ antiporter